MDDKTRIELLEKRVESLEKQVALLSGNQFPTKDSKEKTLVEPERKVIDSPKPKQEETFVAVKPVEKEMAFSNNNHKQKEPIIEKPITKKDVKDWEYVIGKVWLPRIFVFVFILGCLWAFRAAISYGIITEPLRVILGYASAGILIWLGHKQIKENRGALGKLLLGASVVLLMFSTFAGHYLYGLIPVFIAFIANVLWVALGIYYANKHHSEWLAILSALGGFVLPTLIHWGVSSPLFIISYFVILYGALLYFSIKKSFSVLYYLSFIILPFNLFIFSWFPEVNRNIIVAAFIVQQVLLFLVMIRNTSYFKTAQLGTLFTSFLFTMGISKWFLSDISFNFVVLAALAVYTIVSILFYVKQETIQHYSDKMAVTISIATFALMFFVMNNLHEDTTMILLTLQGLFTLYLAIRLLRAFAIISGSVVYVIGIYGSFTSDIFYALSIDTLTWMIAIVSLFSLYKILIDKGLDKAGITLSLGFISLFFFSYELLPSEWISMSLIILGSFVIITEFSKSREGVQILGWLIYGYALLMMFSSRSSEAVFSVETFSWIAGITSLLVLAKLYKRNLAKKNVSTILSGIAIGIGLVFLSWVTNIMTAPLAQDAQYLILSGVWVAYALLGMIYGIVKNVKGARLAGVVLLFITLFKIIFIDLPTVSILVRSILFIVVGIVGIIISRLFYKK